MTGNEAIARGAIDAGCRFYAGYPITPQNELIAYMAVHLSASGGIFIQAESELAAINMVFGAAAAGERAMTSSSSPGISLKQEGISYMAGAELPGVIVNVMRGGPGLGNISPSQADYFQATRGGGHGDYRCIVLAPSTVQEAYDFMNLGFDLADKYRNPVMVLADGMLGQMAEPLRLSVSGYRLSGEHRTPNAEHRKKWALTGCKGRKPNIIRSLYLAEGALERVNLKLQEKYRAVSEKEQRYENVHLEGAEIILVAYGSMARIARSAMRRLREKGRKIGMIRPVTLWPFPINAFPKHLTPNTKYLVVEMSYGQMVEDVRLAVDGKCAVKFFGRAGGGIPTEQEIIKEVLEFVCS